MGRAIQATTPIPKLVAEANCVTMKIEIDLWEFAVYNRIIRWPVPVPGVVLNISSAAGGQPMVVRQQWPKEGISRIPYWVYTDPGVYAREQERIFCGRSWAYVALAAEIPMAGDFKRTSIGDKPVVVVRDEAGGL